MWPSAQKRSWLKCTAVSRKNRAYHHLYGWHTRSSQCQSLVDLCHKISSPPDRLSLQLVRMMEEVKPGNDPTEFEKTKPPQEEDEDSVYRHERYGMREIIIPIGDKEIRFNPVTSVFAIVFLWGRKLFLHWCLFWWRKFTDVVSPHCYHNITITLISPRIIFSCRMVYDRTWFFTWQARGI